MLYHMSHTSAHFSTFLELRNPEDSSCLQHQLNCNSLSQGSSLGFIFSTVVWALTLFQLHLCVIVASSPHWCTRLLGFVEALPTVLKYVEPTQSCFKMSEHSLLLRNMAPYSKSWTCAASLNLLSYCFPSQAFTVLILILFDAYWPLECMLQLSATYCRQMTPLRPVTDRILVRLFSVKLYLKLWSTSRA